MTTNADLVLTGTVQSKICVRDETGQICTKVQFKVAEVWKGSLPTNEFTIVYSGGTVGDERLEVSGQVEYEVGEDVVAFLKLNAHGEGVTLGLIQGKFRVTEDNVTGEKVVRNPFHGRRELTNNTAASNQLKSSQPKRGRLTLSDLKTEVQAQGESK